MTVATPPHPREGVVRVTDLRTPLPLAAAGPVPDARVKWAKIIDQERCIGCHACTTACKAENEVPLGVSRTYVKSVDVGLFPEVRRNFQVTRCNQCVDAPCVAACPTSAMFTREDGIVDFSKDSCIGCKACVAACPYDAIFINPEDHSAEKCNFCAHRIDMGMEPACVVVCPVEAIFVGDLNDPTSKVSHVVNREPVAVRRPEKDTKPKLFYRGAHQATLDPLAAELPTGGIFAWAQQAHEDGHTINAGAAPGMGSSSAAAIISYDVGHSVPWDWRVGLYTWTKSIAAGAYAVVAALVVFGFLAPDALLWTVAAPVVAGAFLAITGAVLIWDLEHPERFYFLITRGRWGSWLVKGAAILGVYAAVLAVHFVAGVRVGASAGPALRWLAMLGIPAALMTGVYTAFLFAQAKARDLWQNPLLPPHLAVQAVLAGAAALVPVALVMEPDLVAPLSWTVAGSAAVHLLMILGEVTLPHPTAHARTAVHNLTSGRFKVPFRTGVILSVVALAAPVAPLLALPTALAALVGLLAFEHAYVQAGQSVPLA
jgi:Fe-S-cluster-containing dehydrogenase component/formate-dependent nitrite reductase membrane component NrfD